MCKYCENTDNEHAFLINRQLSLGILGKIPFAVSIHEHEMDGKTYKPRIDIDSWIENTNISYGFKINYCPICGRKLEGDKT